MKSHLLKSSREAIARLLGDPVERIVDIPEGGEHATIGVEDHTDSSYSRRVARKVFVGVIGATVLAFGVALIVLPGPAVIVIPFGLAILGREFHWARRLLQRLRAEGHRALQQLRGTAKPHA